jgi:DNA-binding transcriptional LysR family regulator
MELLQLKYFQVVATNEHITRSAEQLNVSQPAISIIISRLEKELGVPLFNRSGRKMVLNECGRAFLRRVNRILLEIDNAQIELGSISQQWEQTITLSETSPQLIQGVISAFDRLHPKINWRQNVASMSEILKMLHTGQIDLAVTSPGIVDPEIENTVLFEDEFMLAVHEDHPLSSRRSVYLEETINEEYIALQKGFPFRDQSDALFQSIGMVPNIVIEGDHYVRRELMAANMGISISTKSAMRRKLYDKKIRFLEIKNLPRQRSIVLSKHKDRYQPKLIGEFCDFIQDFYLRLSSDDWELCAPNRE